MSAVPASIGRFVWHEHVSDDPAKAEAFYTQLFGWGTEVWKPGESDYMMIASGGRNHGGFGTGMGGAAPHWLGHVRVRDLDETVEKATGAGGTLAAGPIDDG